MSWQLEVYHKNDISIASKEGCEEYMRHFCIVAQAHPETNFETDSGFVPFKAEFPTYDFLKDKTYLSGFELYSDVYSYEQELSAITKAAEGEKKTGGVFGLFKKKANNNHEIYIINPEVDKYLKECAYCTALCTSTADSFEPILACAFASYLAETCNGIIVYEVEDYYIENIKQEMSDSINSLFSCLTPKNLEAHPFEGWS